MLEITAGLVNATDMERHGSTNASTIKSAPAFLGKITTAGKDTDAQGNFTEIKARDRGGI